jgi:NADP-reducing hydrogenase subunit HndB
MKSLKELEEIRNKTLAQIDLRKKSEGVRVVVGMATCGIAAGARPVLTAFVEEVAKRNLSNVIVSQTGCIGVCRLEPMVEIYTPGAEKVTYVKVTPDMVARIVTEHIVNGNPVTEYTIGYYESNDKEAVK